MQSLVNVTGQYANQYINYFSLIALKLYSVAIKSSSLIPLHSLYITDS